MGVPRRKWRGATEETRGGEEIGELQFRATLSPPRQQKRGSSRWWGPGGARLPQVVGAGRCGGGGVAGPRLQPSLGRSRQAHPDALLLQPSSPGHGSWARGHPVCGVTGGSGETRGAWGGRGTCCGARAPPPPLLPLPLPPPTWGPPEARPAAAFLTAPFVPLGTARCPACFGSARAQSPPPNLRGCLTAPNLIARVTSMSQHRPPARS